MHDYPKAGTAGLLARGRKCRNSILSRNLTGRRNRAVSRRPILRWAKNHERLLGNLLGLDELRVLSNFESPDQLAEGIGLRA